MKYVPELDGLRALAVGAVILNHAMPRYFPGGFIGVDCFFVLSGYLITQVLDDEYQRYGSINLGNFYMRRVLRLMPALWAMLAVYVALAVLFIKPVRDHLLAATSAFFYVTNIICANDLGPKGWVEHTWSLGIEEQFYLLWPLALMVLLRNRSQAWKFILLAIVAVMVWRAVILLTGIVGPGYVYASFDTRADGLLIGCLLALAPIDGLNKPAARFIIFPLGFLSVVLLIGQYQSPWYQLLGISLVALCAGWIILAAPVNKTIARLLRWPPLNYCGRISYGIYLWHFPICIVVAKRITSKPILVLILTVTLTLLIASVSYFIIERPALRARKHFQRKLAVMSEPHHARHAAIGADVGGPGVRPSTAPANYARRLPWR